MPAVNVSPIPFGRQNRRHADVNGRLPRHGAIAKFARLNSLTVLTVRAGLRDGLYIVGDDGTDRFAVIVNPSPPLPKLAAKRGRPRTPVDWRKGPKPLAGEIRAGAKRLGMSTNTLYKRLKQGAVVVDPVSHEFVFAADARPTAATGFPVNLTKPMAPARAAQPPLQLRPTLPIDPLIGAHRAGWERHVDAWQQQAIELAEHRPADWTYTRVDALRYLRGRLNALVELAEQDAAAHPPTPEQQAQRVAAAVNIGRKIAATQRLPDGAPLEAVDAARK